MGKIREDLNGLRSNKLEKRRLDLFQVYLNLYESVFTMLQNHPCLLCGRDFANERLLLSQFFLINDLAPLILVIIQIPSTKSRNCQADMY